MTMIIGECLYPNNLLRIPFNVHSETETVCVSIIPSETKSYDLNKVPTLNDIITGKKCKQYCTYIYRWFINSEIVNKNNLDFFFYNLITDEN